MNDITLLTPTYNRADEITRLYGSLLLQSNLNFRWIIVDDGSTDNTSVVVANWFKESPFKIEYFRKENGGKSRATNFGLDHCMDSTFVLILDDDEILFNDAIEIIDNYVEKYKNTNCGGIEFIRLDENKQPIANYPIIDDFFMSVQERKKQNLSIDGYIGYFTRSLKELRFPEYPNERYVGPGVLQMLVGQQSELLWACKALGTTEYLAGGITKQGRKLRIKNPNGMIYYCGLLQKKESGILIRLKYSIMAYAYRYCAKENSRKINSKDFNKYQFLKICSVPGWLLSKIWITKYLH